MNCKEGDLAIVIGGSTTPEMIGMIVKVERPTFNGEKNQFGGLIVTNMEVGWWCSSAGSKIPWRLLSGKLHYCVQRAIADRLLRPIRPGDLHETTDERKEVTA